ncbi:hypothetical protein OMR07_13855 [Methylobacterium organophilum]|nr:hypothetical protein [Methylobacterium organophilum]
MTDRTIAYQGEPGANSHIICAEAYPDWTPLPCPTFEDAFAAVTEGRAQRAMIPIENSIAGRVADIHHLIPISPLHIVAEHFLPIHFQLMVLPGTKLESLRSVHSHVHALGQCRRIIRRMGLKAVVAGDTAGAAREIAEIGDPSRAALAPALADLNMERAYMTGVWAQGYHFFIYDHHGDGQLTLTEWDGATHLLYLISTIANYPQKQVNQIAYQIERYRKGQTTQIIDTAIAIPIDLAEVAIGVFYSIAGMVIGTVLNPIDTLRNIVSLITLGAGSLFNAVWLLLKGAVAVATLGTFGSCGL